MVEPRGVVTPITPLRNSFFPDEPTNPRAGRALPDPGFLEDVVTQPRARVYDENRRVEIEGPGSLRSPLFVQEPTRTPPRRVTSAVRRPAESPQSAQLGWSIALALAGVGAVLGWLVLTFR